MEMNAKCCRLADDQPKPCTITLAAADGNAAREEEVKAVAFQTQESAIKAVMPWGQSMFMYCGQNDQQQHVAVIVTAHRCDAQPVVKCATAALTCCAQPSNLAVWMTRYREACAAGETDRARAMAAMCLQIDPTCFNKE